MTEPRQRWACDVRFLVGVLGSAMPFGPMHGIGNAGEAADPCHECIEIRMEHPRVVRGPSRHEPDAPVSIIRLPDGSFRGFAANATGRDRPAALPTAGAG